MQEVGPETWAGHRSTQEEELLFLVQGGGTDAMLIGLGACLGAGVGAAAVTLLFLVGGRLR